MQRNPLRTEPPHSLARKAKKVYEELNAIWKTHRSELQAARLEPIFAELFAG
jgi:hypothetical protein